MGKDQFLELLVAQLSHQDPLNPLEDKEFIAQLAQFSSLEQMMAVNENLTLLQMSQSAMANAQFTQLIGTEVIASSDTLYIEGGVAPSLRFGLEASAESASVSLIDENGMVARTFELGALSAGDHTIPWDGLDAEGRLLADGAYQVEIQATDAQGATVTATSKIAGVVSGITFANGYPELIIGEALVRPADVSRITNQQNQP
jgi:flagellar basal-body rod modification protein FlgD